MFVMKTKIENLVCEVNITKRRTFVIEVSNKHECKVEYISRNFYQRHFSMNVNRF